MSVLLFSLALVKAIRKETEGHTDLVSSIARQLVDEIAQASDVKMRLRLTNALVLWFKRILWGDAHAGLIIDITKKRLRVMAYPHHDDLVSICPLCKRKATVDPISCSATHVLKIISGMASMPIDMCIWRGLFNAGEQYGNYLVADDDMFSGTELLKRPVHDFRDAFNAHLIGG